jgi:hypothetical protein
LVHGNEERNDGGVVVMTGSRRSRIGRRRLLRRVGAAALGVAGLASATAAGSTNGVQASGGGVTFEDQHSDGESVVVAELQGPADARLRLLDDEQAVRADLALGAAAPGALGARGGSRGTNRQQADVVEEDVLVALNPALEESRSLTAELIAVDGSRLDSDAAFVTLEGADGGDGGSGDGGFLSDPLPGPGIGGAIGGLAGGAYLLRRRGNRDGAESDAD